jgi:acyl carrier protein
MSVEDSVKKILMELLDVEESDLTPEATFIGDLEASSVDLVEVIAAAENEFDIDISDEDAQKLRSVGALSEFIEKKIAGKSNGG